MWLPSPVGGVHVRLEGIDAPEAGQQCTSADGTPWSCGAAATKYAAELAGGRMVECVVIGADEYRRLLGTCSVLDEAGKPDAVSLNTRMVTAGLAVAYRRFSQAYVAAEDEAHAAKRGVWQGEFEMPWDYRARQKTK
jgi:endonuclease YncB( thermonuclease family)